MKLNANATEQSKNELPFEICIGDIDRLWDDANRATTPSHLVITPTDLHQRNLEQRLRKQQRPHSNFAFRRISELAGDITDNQTSVSTALDRVDRLVLLEEVIEQKGDMPVYEHLGAALGTPLEKHIERLERTRSELELVTGFHPRRMETFASLLGDDSKPATVDSLDILAGVSYLHRDLQDRLSSGADRSPSQAVSKTSLLCRALRTLHTDQSSWRRVYPDIETLSVTGISMLTAPVADLCRLLSETTNIDIRVHLREATGPQIRRQVAAETTVGTFGQQGVFEWR